MDNIEQEEQTSILPEKWPEIQYFLYSSPVCTFLLMHY